MPLINYPLDLTGSALTNHIVGEVRAITSNIERFIVPVAGPFYTVTMIVRNNITNAVLLPNTQYKILHHIPEASQDSGKNVCGVVYITDATVPSVRLEYQVVGGQYQNMAPLIAQLISDHPLDPDAPNQIGWGQIFGMPNQYPPTSHIHPANQFLGYSDLVMALENLRVAIANGDNMAISAIYRYIEIMFSSSQYVTVDQLNDLLVTPEPFVKMHPTYAALKQRDDMVANLAMVYGTIGRDVATDGLGMFFRWDHASTTAPDEKHVIRPNHILGNDPGRFVSLLWCQNVLDRHGIDIAIAAKSTLSVNFDIDDAKTPGRYWIENTQLNRAFDYGILEVSLVGGTLDQPAEVHQRMYWDRREATRSCDHLGVWTTWSFVKSRFLSIERNLNTGNVDLNSVVEPDMYYYGPNCPNRPTDEGILSVYSETTGIVYQIAHGRNNEKYFRVVSDGITWSEWYKSMDTVEMRQHGISSAVAVYHTVGATDYLNTIKTPGKYWFANTQPDRPFDYGVLEVTLVGGTLALPAEVHQEAYFAGRRSTRSCNYLGAWGAWSDVVITDLAVDRSLANSDLDDAILPGYFYYSITSDNRPSSYGLLEVRRETSTIVYQMVHSSENDIFIRYRDGNGFWTPWRKVALDTDIAQLRLEALQPINCNLGIYPENIGASSYLLPCYIGESATDNTSIDIFIGGRFVTINVSDIGHLRVSDINTPNGFVYLQESPANTFQLVSSSTPPKYPRSGNMTTGRSYMPFATYGGDFTTSSYVFLGVYSTINGRFKYVRNWFQDIGAIAQPITGTNSLENIQDTPKETGNIINLNIDDDVYVDSAGAVHNFTSDYFNKTLDPVYVMAWKGETITFDLDAKYALQHAAAGYYGMLVQLAIAYIDIATGGLVTNVARKELSMLTPAGIQNGFGSGYHLSTSGTLSIRAPATGLYLGSIVGDTNANARGYLIGHHSSGVQRSTLVAKQTAVHYLNGPVINPKYIVPETLTVYLDNNNRYNVNLYDEFVNQHGSFASHPNLVEIILENHGNIGATQTNINALYNSSWIPEGVRIRVKNYGYIVGKGGNGGSAYGNSTARRGQDGGRAIYSERLFILENYGVIGSGGGGGGAGSDQAQPQQYGYGGGGGGGAGMDVGIGGSATPSPGTGNGAGYAGNNGTLTAGGAGGTTTSTNVQNGDWSQGGAGGAGGGLGQNGSSGLNGKSHYGGTNAGAGGTAGEAIRCTRDVWIQVQGDVRGNLIRFG